MGQIGFVTGYSSWAELKRVEPKRVAVSEGDSKEFLIYLDVQAGTLGEQFLTIIAEDDSGETTEQEVSVSIESARSAGITGAAITENLRDNWFIWVIVIINIILIIAIIAVARRIATAR